MTYQFVEHTADIRLWAEAADQKNLFLELAGGMNDFLFGEGSASGSLMTEEVVDLSSPDEVALLVDWLSKILLLTGIHHGKVIPVEISHISKTDLHATVRVFVAQQIEDIKAVTYHGLAIEATPAGVEACVTFDI